MTFEAVAISTADWNFASTIRTLHGNRVAPLASRDGTHHEKGLGTRGDRVGQRRIGRLVGQVLFAGEEPQERPAFQRDVVADRTAQHRIGDFKCIEDGALGDRAIDPQFDLFAADHS